MNTSGSAYTTLESLLLFQCLHAYGVGAAVFSRISDLLKKNPDVTGHRYFQSGRLSPDALRNFYLERLRREIDHEQATTATTPTAMARTRARERRPVPRCPRSRSRCSTSTSFRSSSTSCTPRTAMKSRIRSGLRRSDMRSCSASWRASSVESGTTSCARRQAAGHRHRAVLRCPGSHRILPRRHCSRVRTLHQSRMARVERPSSRLPQIRLNNSRHPRYHTRTDTLRHPSARSRILPRMGDGRLRHRSRTQVSHTHRRDSSNRRNPTPATTTPRTYSPSRARTRMPAMPRNHSRQRWRLPGLSSSPNQVRITR